MKAKTKILAAFAALILPLGAFAGTLDLAGNPRVFLRDGVGRVDVGCYEYSVLPRGTLLIFR